AGGSREADHLLAPVYHLLIHKGGGMAATPEIRTLNRSQEIRQRSGEVARSHVPGPEARMNVAHRIGHQLLRHLPVDLRRGSRFPRERSLKEGSHLFGHFAPHGPSADVAHIID